MTTRQEIEQDAQRLQQAVAAAVAAPERVDLPGLAAVLQQAAAQVAILQRRAEARPDLFVLPPERRHAYFSDRPAASSTADLHVAATRWDDARARGRSYRAEAQAQVGPLLTPAQAAQRLGVSAVTLNKWRRQEKVLGLRFDDHQYLYPVFQFAASPLQGERGVLRHLDAVLRALGTRTAWEKAHFVLAAQPRLKGQTPLEVLRHEPSADLLDRLYDLAQHSGEMGT